MFCIRLKKIPDERHTKNALTIIKLEPSNILFYTSPIVCCFEGIGFLQMASAVLLGTPLGYIAFPWNAVGMDNIKVFLIKKISFILILGVFNNLTYNKK